MTIKEVRMLRQMSQVELAAQAGIARTHLIRLEQQDSPRLRLDTLSRIAKALNVPTALLVDQGS